MPGDADIAAIASLFSDRGRSKMLLALGDGRALPASMLAAEAGVAASTASRHLSLLLDAQLVTVEQQGRHRYYRLAGPHVGEVIESLARLAPPLQVRSLRQGTRAEALRSARSCYDHLAGRLGVDLMAVLVERGVLDRDDYRLTTPGREQLEDFGLDLDARGKRPLVRYCVDWTERRHHLAGALGAALLTRMLDLRWLERSSSSRALHVSDAGRAGLASTFGLVAPTVTAPGRSRA